MSNPPIGGGVSAAVAGFGAADAFGAVFFDAMRGGMQREARAHTTSACPCGARPRGEDYALNGLRRSFRGQVSDSRAPKALVARRTIPKMFYGEALTLCGLVIRAPGPCAVTVFGVIPITVLLIYNVCIPLASRNLT